MKKIVILIIEDNDDIRESTAEILNLANYEVLIAENGKIGIDSSIKHLPDLIICDIMMPELDGYGVLHLLRKNPTTATIPFIFLTAKSERLDMRKGMELGADDYLIKPFNELEILNAIETRLNKKEREKLSYNQTLDQISTLLHKEGLIELEKEIASRKVRHVQKKQVIYYEGDAANGIYLIMSGKVKTMKVAPDGRELLIEMYHAAQYFGIAALLAKAPYGETAEAVEDTALCLLPKELIEQLLYKYPDVVNKFIKILANHILSNEAQLLQLAYYSVRKRMADVLLRLHEAEPTIRISRDNLASMAGMATETVSRVLGDFISEKLIVKTGTQIILQDALKLQNMKN